MVLLCDGLLYQGALSTLFYLIITTTLEDVYHYSHFIDGETEVSKRKSALLKATQLYEAEQD